MSKEKAINNIHKLIKDKDKYTIDKLSKGNFLLKVGLVGTVCRMSLPVTALTLSITSYHNDFLFLCGFVGTLSFGALEFINIVKNENKNKNLSYADVNNLLDIVKKIQKTNSNEIRKIDEKLTNTIINLVEDDIRNRKLDVSFWNLLVKHINCYYYFSDVEYNKEINKQKELSDIQKSLSELSDIKNKINQNRYQENILIKKNNDITEKEPPKRKIKI